MARNRRQLAGQTSPAPRGLAHQLVMLHARAVQLSVIWIVPDESLAVCDHRVISDCIAQIEDRDPLLIDADPRCCAGMGRNLLQAQAKLPGQFAVISLEPIGMAKEQRRIRN